MKFTNLDLLEKADKFVIEVVSYSKRNENYFNARCYLGHDELASLTDVYSEGMEVCVGNMMIEAAKQLALRLGLKLIVNGEYETDEDGLVTSSYDAVKKIKEKL